MNSKKENGSAILTVLWITTIVSLVCGVLSFQATQQVRYTQITRERLKAQLIAESGLNKAYRAVKSDFTKAMKYSDQGSFDSGEYTVSSVSIEGHANRAQLISEGYYKSGHAKVAVDLENRSQTVTDPSDPSGGYFDLAYNLLVGGVLGIKGNFNAGVDSIFANGNIVLTGSSHTDAITISSAGTITWKKADGSVTTLSNQTPKEVLNAALTAAINLFIEYAKNNGAVYESGSDIPPSPPGGVAYCSGSSAGWSGQGTGCFIFGGDVSLEGTHLNLTSVNGYPALIVTSTSEVKINNYASINGAVIMPSASFKINGDATIVGAILVGQGMTGNGTAQIYAGDGSGFNLPPKQNTTEDVVITAWH